MRGFIQIPLLLGILVVAAVFGGGGYYVATKTHSQPALSNTSAQAAAVAEAVSGTPIATTTEPATSTPSLEQETTNKPPSSPSLKTQAVKVDVCSNIDGAQEVVPGGYTYSAGVCTPMKDVCSNIDGIQSAVPAGMLLSKTHGCLTEKELDKITWEEGAPAREQQKVQAAAAAAAQQCLDAKAYVVSLSQQKELALAEHNTIVGKINRNETGAYGSFIQVEINKENSRYNSEMNALALRLGTAYAEVELYCP